MVFQFFNKKKKIKIFFWLAKFFSWLILCYLGGFLFHISLLQNLMNNNLIPKALYVVRLGVTEENHFFLGYSFCFFFVQLKKKRPRKYLGQPSLFLGDFFCFLKKSLSKKKAKKKKDHLWKIPRSGNQFGFYLLIH